jgi:hypothetical protein
VCMWKQNFFCFVSKLSKSVTINLFSNYTTVRSKSQQLFCVLWINRTIYLQVHRGLTIGPRGFIT